MALLAKQGWRLLRHSYCLLARVYKARYYPNGCFLSAQLGSNPSFTRRSLLGSRGLLHSGIGWRIGVGTSVNIWNDSWLLGPRDGRLSRRSIDTRYTFVFDLISATNFALNEMVVHHVASKDQAARILSIPLV